MTDRTLEEWIASRGISVEDAIAARLGETDTPHLDVHPSMDYLDGFKGVVIPYFEADASPVLVDGLPFSRMRRLGDVPKGAAKYVQGSGTGVHVYLPPFVDWPTVFENPKIPIVITEGEAKAIALCAQGIACIALGGVSSVRNKETGEFLPEARGCKWGGRTVFICFDSDTADNPDVYAAQEAIRAELSISRNADVRIITLPGKPVGFDEDGRELPYEKVGIDDFLMWKGINEFRQLLSLAPSASKLDKEVIRINQSCAVIDDEAAIYDEERDLFYDKSFFTGLSRFASLKLPQVGMAKGGPVEKAPLEVAKEWCVHPNARRYVSTVFKPGEDRIVSTPAGPALNRWQGFRASPGDVKPFLDLTDFIFGELEPEYKDFAIKLLAYKAQNPGKKIPIAVMLVGTKGSGKSMWCDMIRKAFNPASTMLQPALLLSDFNGFIDRNLIVFVDEVDPSVMDNAGDRLKLYISQPTVQLNEKYRPAKAVDNLGLYLMTTNYPEAASFSRDERRYFVVNAPDKKPGDEGARWYKEYLAPYFNGDCGPAIMDYLLNYDLKGWTPPTEAPMTGERYIAYREGLNPVSSLAEQMMTADENVVKLWVESSIEWAKVTKANLPNNPPASLLKKLQQVEAVMPFWPIRPFYSVSEIGLLFPGLSEQLMGNRSSRYKNYTTEQISAQLRTAGIKTLRNRDDPRGFRYRGVIEPFLVIADTDNPDWKQSLTQAEFDALMEQFSTYGELVGVSPLKRR